MALGAGAFVGGGAVAPAARAAEPSDVAVRLPGNGFQHILVDQAHGHVYVTAASIPSNYGDALLVYDLDGNLLQTQTGSAMYAASGMTLSPDGKTLVVVTQDWVLTRDTTTLANAVGSVGNINGFCGGEVGDAGGLLWYTDVYQSMSGGCGAQRFILNSVSPTFSHPPKQGNDTELHMLMATSPGIPDELVESDYSATGSCVRLLDATTTPPPRISQRCYGTPAPVPDAQDLAISPDGSLIGLADGTSGFRLLHTADQSDYSATGYGPAPANSSATAIAFSPDGSLVARGLASPGSEPDILVQSADPAQGDPPHEFTFPDNGQTGDRVAKDGLAFSADGSRLYAVTTDAAGDAYWLHVISNPSSRWNSSFDGPVTVQPDTPYAGAALQLSGRLQLDGPAPDQPVQVTAVRHDADGSHDLAPATVAADGTFTLTDTPPDPGDVTYTVSFAGDAQHGPADDATASATVARAPTTVTLTPADEATTAGVHLDGTLTTPGAALPDGTTLLVQRVTPQGLTTLPPAQVAPDGTFAVDDQPPADGATLYTVSYGGDPRHTASAAWTTVQVTG